MLSPTFLLVFLLINVFLIGMLSAIAIHHAYAHFRPSHHESEKPRATTQVVHLSPAVRQRLLESAEVNFQSVLDKAAHSLEHDLQLTSAELNKQLEKLGNTILNDEMQQYHASLELLVTHAETTLKSTADAVANHQADLQAKLLARQVELESQLTADMVAEKAQLTQLLDTKLADAVTSFLTETLQHNVDLGAQSNYLTAMLEDHKSDIIKSVHDDV
jgi:hypothetical protein